MLAVAVPASANYLLLTPTGTTLTTAQVRAEAAISPGGNNGEYYWLGTGLMQVEVNVLQRNPQGADKQSRLGAQWSFLPETSLTPAVGFGVIDVTSASPEGIAGYIAVTKHFSALKSLGLVSDFAATAGLGAHGIKGFFGSFEAHLALRILRRRRIRQPQFQWRGRLAAVQAAAVQGVFDQERTLLRRRNSADSVLRVDNRRIPACSDNPCVDWRNAKTITTMISRETTAPAQE